MTTTHDAPGLPDDFDIANAAATRAAEALLQLDIDPVVVADAMLAAGLSVWAAKTDRLSAARELLRSYAEVRDNG